jgi:hypothetical protein
MKKQIPSPYTLSGLIALMCLIILIIQVKTELAIFEMDLSIYLPIKAHLEANQGLQMAKKEFNGYVTGYNTVPTQTDSTPCWAGGEYICGRDDVVACPREYPKGTKVEIEGNEYICLDRTAKQYNGRWDISCDKDFSCPYEITGYKKIKILSTNLDNKINLFSN